MEKALAFLKKQWLTVFWGLVLFLVSIEVVPAWGAWAALFLPFFGWVLYKIIKR
jgi:hypothetical protein